LGRSEHKIYWVRLQSDLINESRSIPENTEVVEWTNRKVQNGWQQYLDLKSDFEQVIRLIKPNLIHAGPIQLMAFLPALINFHPLVSMSWGTDMMTDADRDYAWRWVTGLTLKHTDILIADCQAVGKVAEKFGFPKSRMVIFPWGIDLNKYKQGSSQSLRNKLKWGDDFVILNTRNWEERYGVDLVVKSFCKIARMIPQARLVMVGGGSLESELKQIVTSANLNERVSFLGRVDYQDLPQYYQAADLYVSASHSDGSSVSLMEALGCGLPSLVSDIPSSHEWIVPGVQGWLFKDGDLVDLSHKIITAYEIKDQLSSFRKKARVTAEKKADWTKNSQKLFYAYKLAVAR